MGTIEALMATSIIFGGLLARIIAKGAHVA